MWYAAALLFKSIHTPVQKAEPIWEERIVLIQAPTRKEADARAKNIGEREVHSYKTVEGDVVAWMFDGVLTIYEMDGAEIGDGSELFSRFLRDAEVSSLKTPFSEVNSTRQP